MKFKKIVPLLILALFLSSCGVGKFTSNIFRKVKRSLFPKDCRVELTLDTEGFKYFEDRWNYEFRLSERTEVKEIVKAIHFDPPVAYYANVSDEGDYTYDRFGLNQWEFEPDKSYTIKVSKFYSESDCIHDQEQTFQIPALPRKPYFSAEHENVFESDLNRVLPVSISNVNTFDIRYAIIHPDQVVKAVSEYGNKYYKYLSGISWKKDTWKSGSKINARDEQGFDLDKYFGGNKNKAWLALEMSAKIIGDNNKEETKTENFYLQSTNLGITAKNDANSTHVWINTLNKATPVSNVSIKLYHRGSSKGSCETNKEGYCQISYSGTSIDFEKSIIIAEEGTRDIAYLYLGESQVYNYQYYANRAVHQAKVYFDRKLYRPGDRVEIKSFVTEKKNGTLVPYDGKGVHASIRDTKGEEVGTFNLITTAQGGNNFSYTIPRDASLGHYSVSLYLPGQSSSFASDNFQVEEFRPVNFAVDIALAKQLKKEENLKATVIGKYLFGAPMANAKMKYSILKKSKSIYFSDLSDFTFGSERYYEDYYEDDSEDSSGYISGEEGNLNAKGEFQIDAKIGDMDTSFSTKDDEIKIADFYDLKLEASVFDVDGKSVTKTESFAYIPSDHLVGVKCEDRYNSIDKTFKFDLISVDPSGKMVGDKDLKVYVIYNDWSSVLSQGIGKLFFRSNSLEKKIIETKKIRTSLQKSSFEYKAKDSGSYTLIATNKDGLYSRIDFYAYSKSSYYSWDFRSDDSVELKSDKKEYKIGDTAKVLIKSPFADARVIVSIERDRIYETRSYQMKGNSLPVEIPITGEYLPNVEVSVVLLNGRQSLPKDTSTEDAEEFNRYDLGAPKSKTGSVTLKVDTSSKVAPLTVKTDKQEYGPRENVKLSIKTLPGSEVTVSVADRGVLDLVGYRFTNPVSTFYKLWENIVTTFELRNLIIKHYAYQNKGDSPGGDYGDESGGGFGFDSESGLRKDFRHTAYWNPTVIADSDGEANLEFTLPDNLTTFRVMAASSNQGKFAADNQEFRVKKSLVLQKIASRFIRIGDELELGASITNNTKKKSNFKIQIDSDYLVGSGKSENIELNAGQTKEYTKKINLSQGQYLKLREKTSDGELTLKYIIHAEPVSFGDFSELKKNDISDSLQVTVPIKELDPVSVAKASGFTDSSYKYLVQFPSRDKILGNRGKLRLNLSATALTGLKNAFDFYESNPYFCMEQRTSAYLLTISAGELLKEFKYAPPSSDSYDFNNIEKLFLDEMDDFQYSDGSFGLWKEKFGSSGYPYLTAYVASTMQLGRDRGMRINQTAMSHAIKYLEQYVKNPSEDSESSWQTLTMIYSVFNKEKKDTRGIEQSLRDNFSKLNSKSQGTFLLSYADAKALDSISSDAVFKNLYTEYLKKFKWESSESLEVNESEDDRYYYSYYSKAGSLAAYLRLMIRVDSKNVKIPTLVKQVLAEKSMSYWTDTHSTGSLAIALREYRDKFEVTSIGTSASVYFEERNIFSDTFEENATSLAQEDFSIERLFDKKTITNTNLKFERSSSEGRLYFSSSFNYTPVKEDLKSSSHGISLDKKIYQVQGRDSSGEPILEEVNGTLKRGSTYLIKITVHSDKRKAFLMLVDPIPSNTEIINTSFLTENRSETDEESGSKSNYRDWDVHKELRDDRALFSKDYLKEGDTEFKYYIRPLVKGVSLLPASSTFLMYQSSIRANTATNKMKVE